MLRIEVDLFSGRPNPVWLITNEQEATELLNAAASKEEQLIADPGHGYNGLGFREILVQTLADEGSRIRGLPSTFAIGSTAAGDFQASVELAIKIVENMPLRSDIKLLEHDLTPLSD